MLPSANHYTVLGFAIRYRPGAFLLEPQNDRNAIDEGILSFVYLGRDRTVAVIDYLIDNPHRPNGKGLKAEYYADKGLSQLISQETGVLPDQHDLPGHKAFDGQVLLKPVKERPIPCMYHVCSRQGVPQRIEGAGQRHFFRSANLNLSAESYQQPPKQPDHYSRGNNGRQFETGLVECTHDAIAHTVESLFPGSGHPDRPGA
jgi:hypothetical protein